MKMKGRKDKEKLVEEFKVFLMRQNIQEKTRLKLIVEFIKFLQNKSDSYLQFPESKEGKVENDFIDPQNISIEKSKISVSSQIKEFLSLKLFQQKIKSFSEVEKVNHQLSLNNLIASVADSGFPSLREIKISSLSDEEQIELSSVLQLIQDFQKQKMQYENWANHRDKINNKLLTTNFDPPDDFKNQQKSVRDEWAASELSKSEKELSSMITSADIDKDSQSNFLILVRHELEMKAGCFLKYSEDEEKQINDIKQIQAKLIHLQISMMVAGSGLTQDNKNALINTFGEKLSLDIKYTNETIQNIHNDNFLKTKEKYLTQLNKYDPNLRAIALRRLPDDLDIIDALPEWQLDIQKQMAEPLRFLYIELDKPGLYVHATGASYLDYKRNLIQNKIDQSQANLLQKANYLLHKRSKFQQFAYAVKNFARLSKSIVRHNRGGLTLFRQKMKYKNHHFIDLKKRFSSSKKAA